MDNSHLYAETMTKLAEAQTCQNDIANSNIELQRIQLAISTTLYYAVLSSLRLQYNHLVSSVNEKIKERDDKLNEAISKALEIIDNELSGNEYPADSLGMHAVGQIFSYMAMQNIRLQYSAEVNARLSKITTIVCVKSMNDLLGQMQKFKSLVGNV